MASRRGSATGTPERTYGVTTASSAYFPSFSNYSTDYVDIGDKDLNFGMEQSFIPVDLAPWRTLYFTYWAQYVKELYSEEARIMKCTMRLSKGDLAAFEFSDRIYIRDSYWRVLKLSYDANVEGVCQVELIKELSDVTICADTPTSIRRTLQHRPLQLFDLCLSRLRFASVLQAVWLPTGSPFPSVCRVVRLRWVSANPRTKQPNHNERPSAHNACD